MARILQATKLEAELSLVNSMSRLDQRALLRLVHLGQERTSYEDLLQRLLDGSAEADPFIEN